MPSPRLLAHCVQLATRPLSISPRGVSPMLLTTLRMAHPQALLRPVLIALLLLAPLSFAAGARPEPASSPDMAAAAAPGAWPAGRPLAGLLNPDGTLNLNTGYMGSLDPAGWRMETAAGGRPRFVP